MHHCYSIGSPQYNLYISNGLSCIIAVAHTRPPWLGVMLKTASCCFISYNAATSPTDIFEQTMVHANKTFLTNKGHIYCSGRQKVDIENKNIESSSSFKIEIQIHFGGRYNGSWRYIYETFIKS